LGRTTKKRAREKKGGKEPVDKRSRARTKFASKSPSDLERHEVLKDKMTERVK